MGVRNGLTEFARLVDILVNVIGYAGRCGSYSPAVKRMARQYDDEIQRLTMERVPVRPGDAKLAAMDARSAAVTFTNCILSGPA